MSGSMSSLQFIAGRMRVLTLSMLLVVLPAINCTGGQVKYSDPVEMLYDNFWVDADTLQIQVEYNSPEPLPYTMRREASCAKAREMVDERLSALYPSIKNLQYKTRIYKTLYHQKADCRLVVLATMPGLQNELQKKLQNENRP